MTCHAVDVCQSDFAQVIAQGATYKKTCCLLQKRLLLYQIWKFLLQQCWIQWIMHQMMFSSAHRSKNLLYIELSVLSRDDESSKKKEGTRKKRGINCMRETWDPLDFRIQSYKASTRDFSYIPQFALCCRLQKTTWITTVLFFLWKYSSVILLNWELLAFTNYGRPKRHWFVSKNQFEWWI